MRAKALIAELVSIGWSPDRARNAAETAVYLRGLGHDLSYISQQTGIPYIRLGALL